MILYIYILYLFFVAIQSLFTKILNTMLEFFMQLYVWSPKMYPFRYKGHRRRHDLCPHGKIWGGQRWWKTPRGPARLSHTNDQWKQENLEKSFTFQVFWGYHGAVESLLVVLEVWCYSRREATNPRVFHVDLSLISLWLIKKKLVHWYASITQHPYNSYSSG